MGAPTLRATRPKTPGPLRWARHEPSGSSHGPGRAWQALRAPRPMPGSRVGPTPMIYTLPGYRLNQLGAKMGIEAYRYSRSSLIGTSLIRTLANPNSSFLKYIFK